MLNNLLNIFKCKTIIYNIIRRFKSQFSQVYLVNNINDNNQYAAKIQKDQNNFQHELQMTAIAPGLNNPNIIHLNRHGIGMLNYNGKVTNNVNYLILEYCSNENLFYYAYLGRFIERQVKYFFRKILLGVQTLHAAGYCHRDLKLDNILLDQSFNPKITDFLFTTLFRQNNRPIALNDFIGPLIYFSPQILAQQTYNGEKADIFSLGVILIRLITPRTGFETSKTDDNCYQFIIN